MNKERIKVLYLDDEEGNLVAFRANFRRDLDVFTATTAEEALALLDREHIPVVISDQRMPLVTGVDFLAQVKQRHPNTIRMLLTGYADIQAVIDAVNKGRIYAYVTKPWDASDLLLRIQQANEVYGLRADRERMFRRYEQVFASSGDPIVIVDEKGAIHEANPATEKLFGIDRARILALHMNDLLEEPGSLRRSLSGRRRGRAFQNVDLTLRTPSGHTVDGLLTINYLGLSDAGDRLFQAIIKDITDRRQEEQRLVKLNADLDRRVAVRTRQLLEALEDLGSFSYTVAHDLRSPLKNILALSELVKEQSAKSDPAQQEVTERIHRGASRMIDLVDDLLRFSQSNNRELQCGEVRLRPLVQEVIDEIPNAAHNPALKNSVPEGTLVHADAAMLKVVLVNLLSNAVKFTRQVENPAIEVGSEAEEGRMRFWVRDNGVGFDSTGSKAVFGAFKRMHRADQFEGSGIGLAIVQRVINKHGGDVWADSTVGKGTTITVQLPDSAPEQRQLLFAS
ncbi:MAG: PAS domain S-box protein [Flavobacteriales bacterium]|nr:PAS domain S-box protein [Flavobacteriales bacterium]MBK7268855.1 PAS domain S-box protein [Flavobacteriales bacterium]MBK7752167.1 PAS domain S-box protein [Flavobacteriales bacterium]MBK9074352.1 PAS domain S-box protein [Flavobacteriales bacterium]MBK9537887.1 PAS domain S-box protein [Flavobacteriales bacterium]